MKEYEKITNTKYHSLEKAYGKLLLKRLSNIYAYIKGV